MNLFNLQEISVPRSKLISYFRNADTNHNSCVSRIELHEIQKTDPEATAALKKAFKDKSWLSNLFSLKYEEYQRSHLGITQFSSADLRFTELIEASGPYIYTEGLRDKDAGITRVTLKTPSGNELVFSHDVKEPKDSLTLYRSQPYLWEGRIAQHWVYQDNFARKFHDIFEHHLKDDRIESLSDVWTGEDVEKMRGRWNAENFSLVLNAVDRSPSNLKFIKPTFFSQEQYLKLVIVGIKKNPAVLNSIHGGFIKGFIRDPKNWRYLVDILKANPVSVIHVLVQNARNEFWKFPANRQSIQNVIQSAPSLAEKILELIPDKYRNSYSLNSK